MNYLVTITQALVKLSSSLEGANPDRKTKQGKLLGEAFLWDEVRKFAEAKSKEAWANMADVIAGATVEKKEIKFDTKIYPTGDYEPIGTTKFSCVLNVSQPVSRFDPSFFAKAMNESKYKVPIPFTAEQLDKAKQPSTCTVRKKIVERV